MYVLYFILGIIMIATDLGVKYLVDTQMKVGETLPVIENVFHITYVRNTGAAFSMLAGKQIFLIILTAILIAAVLFYIIYKKPTQPVLMLSLTMIIAGGVGNLVDRITKGYVIDFFDFRLINFAVFNIADIFVVCGAVALAVYLIWFDEVKES